MFPTSLNPDAPGRLVPITIRDQASDHREPSPIKCFAFVPNPLPPSLNWSDLVVEHYDRLEQTMLAIGRINGLHKRIGNAAGLLRTLWIREAKLSSQVEGIQTTAEDMVLVGAGRTLDVRTGAREGWNYVQALEHGLSSDLPMSVRLLCEMHNMLLKDVRGTDRRPGQVREVPVFIGDPEKGPDKARFIPPPPGEILSGCLADLERFIHTDEPQIKALLKVALVHYQFETIHPFRDGNGRIGRVMISRSLVKEMLLDHPVVYMSAYINRYKQRYVDLLLKVNLTGGDAWSEWIGFMIEAIRTQANDAIVRSEQLISIRERYHELLKQRGAPVRLFRVVDRLFSMPAMNANEAGEIMEVTSPTAYKDIAVLEEIGVLTEYTGKTRDRDWVAREIINVIEAEDHDTGTD
jgi:cell filamentation protein, protein adenylyltransferase